MRLWRVDNPNVAMNLIPWFVPTEQNPIQMSWRLHEMLRKKPKDVFCIVALKKRIIQAVLIAYKEKHYIWLWQAHARKGFRYSRFIFDGLKHWTKSVGMKRIKCRSSQESNRKLYEKYGFRSKRNKEMYINVA